MGGLRGQRCHLADLISEAVFERNGDELAAPGLFVALQPWHFHVLALQPAVTGSSGKALVS